MFKRIVLGVILLTVIATGVLFALKGGDNYDASRYEVTASNGINTGSKLTLTLPDQFDVSHSLSESTQKIILVFSKETGHTVKEFLKQQEKGFLKSRNALFVADISPMPTIIRNTFALPDLKKSEYSVLLIYDEKIAETLKNGAQTDKIAVISLENKTITDVKFITTADELKSELQ